MLLVVLGAMSAACGSAQDPDPVILRDAQLQVVARSSNPAVVGMYQGGGALSLDHIWLSWQNVSLYACAMTGQRLDIASGVTGDIAAGVTQPFTVDDGEFCAITTAFVPAAQLPAAAPQDFRWRAMLLQGTAADGSPFMLASELNPNIALQSTTAIPLHTDPVRLLISFDVATAFDGVDLSAATLDTEGTVRIENDRNSELLAIFEEQLPHAFSLHVDVEGDGLVGPDDVLIAQSR